MQSGVTMANFTIYTKVSGDTWRRGRRTSRSLSAATKKACATERGGLRAKIVNDTTGREHAPRCTSARKRAKKRKSSCGCEG